MTESAPPRVLTAEELAEYGIEVQPTTELHPFFEESQRRRAERAARDRDPTGPTAIARKLTAGPLNGSRLFTQYLRPSQLSTILATVSDETGARFKCAREYSLIDGTCIGVRVTYKGTK